MIVTCFSRLLPWATAGVCISLAGFIFIASEDEEGSNDQDRTQVTAQALPNQPRLVVHEVTAHRAPDLDLEVKRSTSIELAPGYRLLATGMANSATEDISPLEEELLDPDDIEIIKVSGNAVTIDHGTYLDPDNDDWSRPDYDGDGRIVVVGNDLNPDGNPSLSKNHYMFKPQNLGTYIDPEAGGSMDNINSNSVPISIGEYIEP